MTNGELFRRVIFPGALAVDLRRLALCARHHVADVDCGGDDRGVHPVSASMAMQAREFMLIDVVVLSILIYALLGKLADSVARVLERFTLSWHPAFQKH